MDLTFTSLTTAFWVLVSVANATHNTYTGSKEEKSTFFSLSYNFTFRGLQVLIQLTEAWIGTLYLAAAKMEIQFHCDLNTMLGKKLQETYNLEHWAMWKVYTLTHTQCNLQAPNIFLNRYTEKDKTHHGPQELPLSLFTGPIHHTFPFTNHLVHCPTIKSCCGDLQSQLQLISPAWICLQECQESDT